MKNWMLIFLLAIGLESCGQTPTPQSVQPSASPVIPTATSTQATTLSSTVYASYTLTIPPADTRYTTYTRVPTGTRYATDTPTSVSTKTRATSTPYNTLTPRDTPTPLPPLGASRPITLTSLHMTDAKIGWGIESTGHIVRTMDGGSTWRNVTPASGQYDTASFFALDRQNAWAAVPTSIPCNASSKFSCPAFFTWQTTDGGATWQRGMPFQVGDFNFQLAALQFISPTIGWLLYISRFGMGGITEMALATTDDGGISWMGASSPGDICPVSMVFLNDQDGWSGTDCSLLAGIIPEHYQDFLNGKVVPSLYKTDKGGSSWDSFPMPAPTIFSPSLTPDAYDPNQSIFCGVSKIDRIHPETLLVAWSCRVDISGYIYDYLTSDHGQSWRIWLATGNEHFVNSATGWRMFSPGNGQSNQLQQTTDGGRTWMMIQKVAWPAVQFDFVNEQTGWAIVTGGDVPALVHTRDGGVTWNMIKPFMEKAP